MWCLKGIGAATAIELSKCGASTILLARNKKDLNQIISQLDTNQKQTHSFIIADFQNPVSLKKEITSFLNTYSKPIEILINNTGGPKPGPAMDASPEDFINAFNQHLISNHVLVNSLVSSMKKIIMEE